MYDGGDVRKGGGEEALVTKVNINVLHIGKNNNKRLALKTTKFSANTALLVY